MRIIGKPGCVVAFVAGHYHKVCQHSVSFKSGSYCTNRQGGYAVDPSGIHHITLQSPLIHGKCYGYLPMWIGTSSRRAYAGLAEIAHSCYMDVEWKMYNVASLIVYL